MKYTGMYGGVQGAAFGFSTIAAQAKEQLAPYLPLLVPRLFRSVICINASFTSDLFLIACCSYRYDPNPSVQQAMNSIWTAVVPESQKEVIACVI